MEKTYKYETHLHTKEGSACGTIGGAELVRLYKKLGYAGIIVTDHFFGGNTAVPFHLPWDQRIDLFFVGYERAKEEGEKIGLQVFFGMEMGFLGTEFLIYGIEKQWLKNHSDIIEWSVEKQYEMVHAEGGMIVHAHPFREASYIPKIRLYPEHVDAVEVYNLCNLRNPQGVNFNERALLYANTHNLPITGGGDCHGVSWPHGGMEFQTPLLDIQDYIQRVQSKKQKYEIIKEYNA